MVSRQLFGSYANFQYSLTTYFESLELLFFVDVFYRIYPLWINASLLIFPYNLLSWEMIHAQYFQISLILNWGSFRLEFLHDHYVWMRMIEVLGDLISWFYPDKELSSRIILLGMGTFALWGSPQFFHPKSFSRVIFNFWLSKECHLWAFKRRWYQVPKYQFWKNISFF